MRRISPPIAFIESAVQAMSGLSTLKTLSNEEYMIPSVKQYDGMILNTHTRMSPAVYVDEIILRI